MSASIYCDKAPHNLCALKAWWPQRHMSCSNAVFFACVAGLCSVCLVELLVVAAAASASSDLSTVLTSIAVASALTAVVSGKHGSRRCWSTCVTTRVQHLLLQTVSKLAWILHILRWASYWTVRCAAYHAMVLLQLPRLAVPSIMHVGRLQNTMPFVQLRLRVTAASTSSIYAVWRVALAVLCMLA
jgi:hypothetical protein